MEGFRARAFPNPKLFFSGVRCPGSRSLFRSPQIWGHHVATFAFITVGFVFAPSRLHAISAAESVYGRCVRDDRERVEGPDFLLPSIALAPREDVAFGLRDLLRCRAILVAVGLEADISW